MEQTEKVEPIIDLEALLEEVQDMIEERRAIEELGIYKPYIRGFKQDNTICYFEQYAGFWAYQDEELMEKIKEFEERTGKSVNFKLQFFHSVFGSCRKHTCLYGFHHVI